MSFRADFSHISEYDAHRPSCVAELADERALLTAMFALANSDPENGAASLPAEIMAVERQDSGIVVASLVLMDMDMKPQHDDEITAVVREGIWIDVRHRQIVINGLHAREAYFRRRGKPAATDRSKVSYGLEDAPAHEAVGTPDKHPAQEQEERELAHV